MQTFLINSWVIKITYSTKYFLFVFFIFPIAGYYFFSKFCILFILVKDIFFTNCIQCIYYDLFLGYKIHIYLFPLRLHTVDIQQNKVTSCTFFMRT